MDLELRKEMKRKTFIDPQEGRSNFNRALDASIRILVSVATTLRREFRARREGTADFSQGNTSAFFGSRQIFAFLERRSDVDRLVWQRWGLMKMIASVLAFSTIHAKYSFSIARLIRK